MDASGCCSLPRLEFSTWHRKCRDRLAWAHPKLDKFFKSHGGAKRWRPWACQLRFWGFLVRLCDRAKRQGAGPGVVCCHCKRREGGNPGVGGVWSIKPRSILKRSFCFLAFSSSHTGPWGGKPDQDCSIANINAACKSGFSKTKVNQVDSRPLTKFGMGSSGFGVLADR